MIKPTSITNFDRSDAELETFWIFCLVVAGKNSDWAAQKVLLLLSKRGALTPFQYLRQNQNALHNLLVANKVGQYTRMERAITQSLDVNLRTASVEELEGIFGVGPKTASFFLMHSRADFDGAVLDVHILRWLRDNGCEDAPIQTPSSNPVLYRRLSKLWSLLSAAKYPMTTPAERDLLIWAKYSGRLTDSPVAQE